MEFYHAIFDPKFSLLSNALIATILASMSFGIVGTFVVAKRISYIAGSIAHCILGGIGAGLYCQKVYQWDWLHPLLGATIAALLAAIIIGLVSLYAHEREDTIIGALWATGMATGLMFLAKTPGYIDPMSYLFGNILMITPNDLWFIAILDLVIVIVCFVSYNKLQAIFFDEEFARLRGIKTNLYYLFLLCLIAITIVFLVTIVGIVLVIALLTLPTAIASSFSKKLWQMMIYSATICLFFCVSGLFLSYEYDLPTGPTIIILTAFVYFFILAIKKFFYKKVRLP